MKQILDLDNMNSGIFGVASPSLIRDFHSHPVSQLSIPVNGVMYVIVNNELFIVPPGMAVFIPKDIKHCIQKINDHTVIENIFFTDIYKKHLPDKAKSFCLSKLARELVSKICKFDKNEFATKKVMNLITVLFDELGENNQLSYSLKIPQNPLLFKIYELFVQSNDEFPNLTDVSELVHVSSRTLQRLFKTELGVSFVLWKQQFIFIKALELLTKDKSTTTVAYKLGYNSDSAFISMFKKMSGGRLPSSFFKESN